MVVVFLSLVLFLDIFVQYNIRRNEFIIHLTRHDRNSRFPSPQTTENHNFFTQTHHRLLADRRRQRVELGQPRRPAVLVIRLVLVLLLLLPAQGRALHFIARLAPPHQYTPTFLLLAGADVGRRTGVRVRLVGRVSPLPVRRAAGRRGVESAVFVLGEGARPAQGGAGLAYIQVGTRGHVRRVYVLSGSV